MSTCRKIKHISIIGQEIEIVRKVAETLHNQWNGVVHVAEDLNVHVCKRYVGTFGNKYNMWVFSCDDPHHEEGGKERSKLEMFVSPLQRCSRHTVFGFPVPDMRWAAKASRWALQRCSLSFRARPGFTESGKPQRTSRIASGYHSTNARKDTWERLPIGCSKHRHVVSDAIRMWSCHLLNSSFS